MHAEDKKEALRAYKERKRAMGVFEVRCGASGQCWVGRSRNLDTQQNHIWFALKLGSYPKPSLQQAWATHGPDAFSYRPLEQLTEEETASPDGRLKALHTLWCARLSAEAI